jgi:RNA polymerase sigma-70 factor (ECF subfamily)
MTTEEYNTCVDEHSDAVFRFILKSIRIEAAAMDIVQEAFTKMWERVENISASKARSYLFSTAYHTMIDQIRKNSKQGEYQDAYEEKKPVNNTYSDLKEILEVALNTLPRIQRSVILLRDYEGYSYKEIGDITNLNESQVKVYIYRARISLQKYIGKPENVL